MRVSKLFYSLLCLLFCAFLIGVGICFIYFSQSKLWQEKIILFFSKESILVYIGLSLVGFGILLTVLFLSAFRRKYYIFLMGESPVSIDTKIILKELKNYLNQMFPQRGTTCDVTVQKQSKRLKYQQLEFFAGLPYVALEEREEVLTCIENYLKENLEKHYGYREEFLFNVDFKDH